MNQKVFKKVDAFLKENKLTSAEERILRDYGDYVKQAKPKTKDNYIGIEIECLSPDKTYALQKSILEMDLENNIYVGYDSSISGKGNTYELKILVREKELKTFLKKLKGLFTKHNITSNNSCGLHIHLDMRNRSFAKCLARLNAFKHLLFPIVDKKRWSSTFCKFEGNHPNDRYAAINALAFQKHRTIEVRLLEGTVDLDKIYKWSQLLIKIISTTEIPKSFEKKEVLKLKFLDKQLKTFVKSKWNDAWPKAFKRIKMRIAAEQERRAQALVDSQMSLNIQPRGVWYD